MDIVSRAPQLIRLHGSEGHGWFDLSWEVFCCMADRAGASLLEFENIPIGGRELCRTQPFRSLTALRSLTWDSPAKFAAHECKGLRDCFPHLVSLKISRCDASFLRLLSHNE
jgi:hypothetical protein